MRYVATTAGFDAQFLHGFAQINFSTLRNLQRGVVALQDFEHASAVEWLDILIGSCFAEASGDHLGQVFLLLVVLVELLNTLHLLVVEPVGRLVVAQLMEHLSVELFMIDVAHIVDELALGNRQADAGATGDAGRWSCHNPERR